MQKLLTTILLLTTPSLFASNHPPADCETPASVACVYGFTPQVPGCPIKSTTLVPNTGWGTIAVVDSQHNSAAQSDLNTFSTQYNLPLTTVQVVYADSAPSQSPLPGGCPDVLPVGAQPSSCVPAGSCDEQVLDLEWAHAMAPNAQLILVEAQTGNTADRLYAVCYAKKLVAAAGGGVVSISWSTPEFPQETAYDSYFQGTPNVLFISSAGDYSAPARYPSTSPYVISAGGTSFVRNAQKNFVGETAWSTVPSTPVGQKNGGSGGASVFEPRPAYQNSVQRMVGSMRGTPDIAFLADPASGVCVYSTFHPGDPGWFRDGGTSLSAPGLAGVINSAHNGATTTTQELTMIYTQATKNYHAYWHDITSGNNGFPALVGYDFTTGLGSPLGYGGK